MNLTPYQDKRNKQFSSGTTPEEAIALELMAYWKKSFPKIHSNLNKNCPLKNETIANLTPILAPIYAFDPKMPWTKVRIDNLLDSLLVLEEIIIVDSAKRTKTANRLDILPKHHKKHVKRLLTAQSTREKLSKSLNSNKAGKKYLRIIHKRLGIYKKRKPPFNKILKIETN